LPNLPAHLLDDFDLSDARGGRRPSTTTCDVVRSLTPDDLPKLNSRELSPRAELPTLLSLRTAHHQLAQLLAKGTEQNLVALITGYSPAYISRLKGDPAFKELLDFYSSEREKVFVDVLERMKALGVATLEELQERLTDDPSSFSNRELHEQLRLLLVDPAKPGSTLNPTSDRQGVAAGSGVVVNVNFVSSETPRPTLDLQVNAPTED